MTKITRRLTSDEFIRYMSWKLSTGAKVTSHNGIYYFSNTGDAAVFRLMFGV